MTWPESAHLISCHFSYSNGRRRRVLQWPNPTWFRIQHLQMKSKGEATFNRCALLPKSPASPICSWPTHNTTILSWPPFRSQSSTLVNCFLKEQQRAATHLNSESLTLFVMELVDAFIQCRFIVSTHNRTLLNKPSSLGSVMTHLVGREAQTIGNGPKSESLSGVFQTIATFSRRLSSDADQGLSRGGWDLID